MGVFGSSGHSSFTGEWERQRASRKLTQVPWLEHGSWRGHRPRDWFVDGLGMMRGRFVVVLAAEWGSWQDAKYFMIIGPDSVGSGLVARPVLCANYMVTLVATANNG